MRFVRYLGAGLFALLMGCDGGKSLEADAGAPEQVLIRERVIEKVIRECPKPPPPSEDKLKLEKLCADIYADSALEAKRDAAVGRFHVGYAAQKRREMQSAGYGDIRVRKYNHYVLDRDVRNGCFIHAVYKGTAVNRYGKRIYKVKKELALQYNPVRDSVKKVSESPEERLPLMVYRNTRSFCSRVDQCRAR